MDNYSNSLQPVQSLSTIGNNPSFYMFFSGNTWNSDNTVGSGLECYGQSVLWANMTCPTQTYTYDHMKRLTAVSDTYYSRNFQYDVYGNMSVSNYSSAPSVSSLMPLSAQNPYNASNNQLIAATYGDARGNMTAIGAVNSIQYDGESRQIYTSDSGTGQSIGYLYDGMGQRMERQIAGGATTFYIHDAFGNLAAEYNSSGVTPACGTCYLSYDELGSLRLVTDESAQIIARHDYLPFGEEILNGEAGRGTWFGFGNSATITQMFTGKERDAESGLDYFRARYYGSALGRFTSPDPLMATPERFLDPQEWNLYGYARNNPLSITDPTGLDIWLQGCGKDSSTCQGNYVGTTDADGNFTRTHLTGDQTANATIGTNGITVTQGGNTYQGVWDRNPGEQGNVLVSGAGDLSSFNANLTGACQNTCVASGVLQNKDGTPATADAPRSALTNPDGSAKPGWFANNNDPFHRHDGTNDTSFNAMNPDTAGQRSTDVTVPQLGGSLDSRFHVNSGYPFEDAYQMTRHVISIMHTFLNAAGITHPTTQ